MSSLWAAAETGDIKRVRQFLERNAADANATDRFGATPLFWAVAGGNVEIAQILVGKLR